MLTSQRWWRSFPFVLALISLIFIGWSAYLSFTYPHDGILSYSNNGVISELDTFGEDDNQLRVGDKIISVDGVPLIDAIPFYVDKSPEEMVIFVVARDGEQKTLPVMLEPPGTELIIDLVVILVLALVFWGMGVGVLAFKPGDMTSNLFFLFTQVSALMLAAGLSSSVGPPIFSSIFNALLWVMGPITVHLHYYFPQQVQFRRRREILLGLYAIALLGGLPYLLLGAKTIRSFLWASQTLHFRINIPDHQFDLCDWFTYLRLPARNFPRSRQQDQDRRAGWSSEFGTHHRADPPTRCIE